MDKSEVIDNQVLAFTVFYLLFEERLMDGNMMHDTAGFVDQLQWFGDVNGHMDYGSCAWGRCFLGHQLLSSP